MTNDSIYPLKGTVLGFALGNPCWRETVIYIGWVDPLKADNIMGAGSTQPTRFKPFRSGPIQTNSTIEFILRIKRNGSKSNAKIFSDVLQERLYGLPRL